MAGEFETNGINIVFVDDSDEVRKPLSRYIESCGYTARPFASPTEALAQINKDPDQVDILVTEYKMPGLGGHELAERVRQVAPDTLVCMLTGDEEILLPSERREIAEMGVDRVVSKIAVKPSPLEILKDTLAEFADIIHNRPLYSSPLRSPRPTAA